jgi:hypothetical protein
MNVFSMSEGMVIGQGPCSVCALVLTPARRINATPPRNMRANDKATEYDALDTKRDAK